MSLNRVPKLECFLDNFPNEELVQGHGQLVAEQAADPGIFPFQTPMSAAPPPSACAGTTGCPLDLGFVGNLAV